MHLRDDHALGAVDDEGAVVGHERDVAHVDILLLDVLDRFGARLLVNIEHDETQRHLERRRVGHAALAALVDVVFRRFELVLDEFEHRGVGKIRDREHRLEDGLQPLVGTAADGLLDQQELVIGCLLNLDEVRHLCDFLDFPEKLTNALATSKRLRHLISRFVEPSGPGRLSRRPPSIAAIGTTVETPYFTRFGRRRTATPPPGGDMDGSGVCSPRNRPQRIHTYLSSTLAPAFSSWALTFSASSLFTPSLTGLGAPSTRSLASLRPSPVSARTSLITSIFFSPAAVSTTVNSVFSSTGAAAAPPGAAATATAAAAETPHFSSSIFARSAASRTVSFERSSTSFCRSAIEHPYGFEPVEFCRADHAASLLVSLLAA